MVNNKSLDLTFDALAHPNRRAILQRLGKGPCPVRELYGLFDSSKAAVSKHLAKLESAGMIRREVRGREHLLILADDSMTDARQWIETQQQFWQQRLTSLEDYLSKKQH